MRFCAVLLNNYFYISMVIGRRSYKLENCANTLLELNLI